MPRRNFANRGSVSKKAERQAKLNTLQGLVNRRNQIIMTANERAHNMGIRGYVQPQQIAFEDVKAQIETDRDLDEQISIYRAATQTPLEFTEADKFVAPSPYMAELEVRTTVANRRAKTEYEYAKRHNKEEVKNKAGKVVSKIKLTDRLPTQRIHAKELSEYSLEGFRKHAEALVYRTTGTGSTERWISYQKNYITGVNALLDNYAAGRQGIPDREKQAIAQAVRVALLQLDPNKFRAAYYSRVSGDIDYLQSAEAQNLKDEEVEKKLEKISEIFKLGIYDKNGDVNWNKVNSYLE